MVKDKDYFISKNRNCLKKNFSFLLQLNTCHCVELSFIINCLTIMHGVSDDAAAAADDDDDDDDAG